MTLEEAVTTVCEHYNYQLVDFYGKSFADGGLTYGQLSVLYRHFEKRLVKSMEFDAAIVGAKIEKPKPEEKANLFKSPEEYEKLDPEERKRLTKQMMANWKGVSFGAVKSNG